jgi:phytoene dehydrogenase-like protein
LRDLEKLSAQLDRIEPGAGERLPAFLENAGYKYRVARERFVGRSFRHLFEFVTPRNLFYLLKTEALANRFRRAARYFRPPLRAAGAAAGLPGPSPVPHELYRLCLRALPRRRPHVRAARPPQRLLRRRLRSNFDAIFPTRRFPQEPALYIAAPGRTDPSVAPPGHDALMVLVPVSHLAARGTDWRRDEPAIRAGVYARLEELGLTDLRRHIRVERHVTPLDRRDRYGLTLGPARPQPVAIRSSVEA